MRLHIAVDDAIVEELDRLVGPRGRSRFIEEMLVRTLEDERRWGEVESALGSIRDIGHAWDDDPAEWVHQTRRGDDSCAG